jgi:hypothetical protein
VGCDFNLLVLMWIVNLDIIVTWLIYSLWSLQRPKKKRAVFQGTLPYLEIRAEPNFFIRKFENCCFNPTKIAYSDYKCSFLWKKNMRKKIKSLPTLPKFVQPVPWNTPLFFLGLNKHLLVYTAPCLCSVCPYSPVLNNLDLFQMIMYIILTVFIINK